MAEAYRLSQRKVNLTLEKEQSREVGNDYAGNI